MVKLEGAEEESQRIHRDIRDIRVSGVVKLLHNEIAIRDCVGAVRCKGRVSEDLKESKFSISGFSVTRKSREEKLRNLEM